MICTHGRDQIIGALHTHMFYHFGRDMTMHGAGILILPSIISLTFLHTALHFGKFRRRHLCLLFCVYAVWGVGRLEVRHFPALPLHPPALHGGGWNWNLPIAPCPSALPAWRPPFLPTYFPLSLPHCLPAALGNLPPPPPPCLPYLPATHYYSPAIHTWLLPSLCASCLTFLASQFDTVPPACLPAMAAYFLFPAAHAHAPLPAFLPPACHAFSHPPSCTLPSPALPRFSTTTSLCPCCTRLLPPAPTCLLWFLLLPYLPVYSLVWTYLPATQQASCHCFCMPCSMPDLLPFVGQPPG